jgi:hypothetical protein
MFTPAFVVPIGADAGMLNVATPLLMEQLPSAVEKHSVAAPIVTLRVVDRAGLVNVLVGSSFTVMLHVPVPVGVTSNSAYGPGAVPFVVAST